MITPTRACLHELEGHAVFRDGSMGRSSHGTQLRQLTEPLLARNEDLHGKEKDEQERKRLEKLHPRVIAFYSKVDLLLACDKPIFELPILERMKLHSREIETWVRFATPTVM